MRSCPIKSSLDLTPFYLYDRKVLKKRVFEFLETFDKVLYAVKANCDPFVVKELWNLGVTHFDVASVSEMDLVDRVTHSSGVQHYMHPSKSSFDIRESVKHECQTYVVDSMAEIQKLREIKHPFQIMVRLAVHSKDSVFKLSEKFGCTEELLPELIKEASTVSDSVGVCFHVGSQCMNPEAFREAFDSIKRVLRLHPYLKLSVIDVGGGFPVEYANYQPPPLSVFFDVISEERKLFENEFYPIQLWSEPGRALVAEAFSLAIHVISVNEDRVFVNSGTYQHFFDTGFFGFQYKLMNVFSDKKLKEFKLLGRTCDSSDVIFSSIMLPEDISEGFELVFSNMGAYCDVLKTKFNGFEYPSEFHFV